MRARWGWAQLGDDGVVRQIDEVPEVSTIDLSSFRTSSFHFNDRRFILGKPVRCSLEYRNNLWVYECPRYGLHAFSEDRQEALRQLGEEFAFLYEGLINEPDENLTPDAIELRDLLKADSVRVEGTFYYLLVTWGGLMWTQLPEWTNIDLKSHLHR